MLTAPLQKAMNPRILKRVLGVVERPKACLDPLITLPPKERISLDWLLLGQGADASWSVSF